MSKMKKLMLGLSIVFTMMIAFVVGVVGLNNKPETFTEQPFVPSRKIVNKTYNFKEGEVSIQNGTSSIEFSYSPDSNQSSTSVAYQYRFNNPMNADMAINLKQITAENVTISYEYSDVPLDEITETQSVFEIQRVPINSTKYIYIVVTSTGEEVTNFSSSVIWNQGEAGTLIVHDTDDAVYNVTIVRGQTLNDQILATTIEVGEYGIEWYKNKSWTLPADERTEGGAHIYIRNPNLPTDWLELSGSEWCVKKSSSRLPAQLVIPATYGGKNVTHTYNASSSTDGVFYNSANLSRVNLPYTFTSIGNSSFYLCQNIASINLNTTTNLTRIGDLAFSLNATLTSLDDLSKYTKLTSIGTGAFAGCVLIEGEINLERCKSLRTIGVNAFWHCYKVYKIVLPNSITSIGKSAFDNCVSLTSINIPTTSSLATIPESAFNGCRSLPSITIPSNIRSIGTNAFAGCISLFEIYNLSSKISPSVGGSATSYGGIGVYAKVIHTSASATSKIQEIDGVKYYVYGDVFMALTAVDKSRISNTKLDYRTTSIYDSAFDGAEKLNQIDLSECLELKTIGVEAFKDCVSLASITIPYNVTSIGEEAFSGCECLYEVYDLSNSLTIEKDSSNGYIGNYAQVINTDASSPSRIKESNGVLYYVYEDTYKALTSTYDPEDIYITLDSQTTSIAATAFEYSYVQEIDLSNCNMLINSGSFVRSQSLRKVVLPRTLIFINTEAFLGCSNLQYINTSNCESLHSIGDSAFAYCLSLKQIDLPKKVDRINDSAFTMCVSLENMDLSEHSDLTSIGSRAFSDCPALTEVKLPDSVTDIPNNMFYNCISLENVRIPSAIENVEKSAFNNCSVLQFNQYGNGSYLGNDENPYLVCVKATDSSITTCTINKYAKIIANKAFENSTSITSVNTDDDALLVKVGDYAFSGCTALTNIDFDECMQLQSMGNYSFQSCSLLSSVSLPSSLTTIGNYTFASTGLTSMSLSDYTGLTSIGDGTFSNCTSLTSVDLSDCTLLTSIGASTFKSSGLTSIDLGNCTELTTIGSESFKACTSLASVSFPTSLTAIGNSAFETTGLESIQLDHTAVTLIDNAAFNECALLTTVTVPSSLETIGKYTFASTKITSMELDHTVVTTIRDYAFNNCTSLTSVKIPSNLITLGNWAFAYTKITSMQLDHTALKSIGGYAFYNCDELKSVPVSNSLETIGESAFAYTKITSMQLDHTTLTTIGAHAFEKCYSLTSVTVPSSLATIESYAFASSGLTSLLLEHTVITSISSYLFNNCASLTSVTVPSSLATIGAYAFTSSGLTSIELSHTIVTSIGDRAFSSCKSLTNVTVSSSLSTMGQYLFFNTLISSIDLSNCSNLKSIGTYSLSGCTRLNELTLPNSLTTIKSYAFSDCYALADFDFPSDLRTIGTYAFYNCYSLTSMVIPSKVTSIEDFAFQGCQALYEVYDLSTSLTITTGLTTNGYVGYYSKVVNTSLSTATQIKVADNCKYYLGNQGFGSSCTTFLTPINRATVTSLTLTYKSSSYTTLDIVNTMFMYCYSLQSVDITNSGRYYFSTHSPSFTGCSSLTTVYLHKNITKISDYAFQDCTSLTGITLPSSLRHIGSYAFQNCTSLISIGLPGTVTSIGNYAFDGCKSLKSVTLSSSLQTIGSYAFQNCRSLTNISIPSTVTSIGTDAFRYCYGLSIVYDLSTSLTITKGATSNGYVGYYASAVFTDSNSSATIEENNGVRYYVDENNYIAIGLVDESSTSIALDPQTTGIKSYAFYNCDTLTSVDLTGCTALTTIGDNAFDKCDTLTSIGLPTSLTTIGYGAFSHSGLTSMDLSNCTALSTIDYYAFYKCDTLTSIDLSNCTSLESIGGYAFRDCNALTSVDLSGCTALTTIGDYAFYDCDTLTSIDLSNCTSLESIENSAFRYCNALTEFVVPASVSKIGIYAFDSCSRLASLTFENTDKWIKTTSSTEWYSMSGGTAVDASVLSDPATNATNFRGTSGYYNYYWYKEPFDVVLNANGGTFEGVELSDEYKFGLADPVDAEFTLTKMGGYNFTLNSSTGYYVSGNKGVKNSYSLAKITFNANAGDKVTFTVISSGENNYDFGIFSNLNTTLTASSTADTYNVYKSFKGLASTSTQTVTYTITQSGENYIHVKYIKDGSGNSGNDSLQIKSTISIEGFNYEEANTKTLDKLGELATPVREGYSFVGWFTDPTDGTQVSADTVIDADTTLYAHWEKVEPTITVTTDKTEVVYGTDTATLTATTTPDMDKTYQWYRGTTAEFMPDETTLITDATSATYTHGASDVEVGTYYYKCIVTVTYDDGTVLGVTSDAISIAVVETATE